MRGLTCLIVNMSCDKYVCELGQILSEGTPHICCEKKNRCYIDLVGEEAVSCCNIHAG